MLDCKQTQGKDLATFYKHWNTNLEAVECKWGEYVPTKLPAGADEDVERKKFQAFMFLNCINWHCMVKWLMN